MRALEFNETACRQLGYTRDEFARLRITDYEAVESKERITTRMRQALGAEGTSFDTLHRTKSGDLRQVHVWAHPVVVRGRTMFHAVVRDTTESSATARALRHSTDLLDQAGRIARIGGWDYDVETKALRWTPEVYRIHGMDPLVTPSIEAAVNFYSPEDRATIAAAFQVAIDHGTAFDVELPMVSADNRRRWVRVQGTAEQHEGKTVRVYGALQDITDARNLEEQRRLQSAALNAAANAIVITDREGTVEWVNPAFCHLTGYTTEEAIGHNPRELVRSGVQSAAFYKEFWDTIRSGRVWQGKVVNRRKDGSRYNEELVVTPILNATDEITHFVAIKTDVSDRDKLEAQFLQAQKMEAVGQLASGIAHDFNNLLTVINGMAELLALELQDDSQAISDLREIQHAGERATGLTRQLLAFSRQQVLEPRVWAINTILVEFEKLLTRLLGEDIEVRLLLAENAGHVRVDRGQLEQVVANLAVNARDAMPQGGRLTLETKPVDVDDTYCRQHSHGLGVGPHVMLSVSDSGSGMDEATKARVFEPFFTTKGVGKGTGLGLSTVFGIVKQSGGAVAVYSEVGLGTTFSIHLPRVDGTGADAAIAAAPGSVTGTETVLIVEDNPALRQLSRRVLESAGFAILEAGTGEAALELVHSLAGAPVDLLVTDVVMPGMSGRQLAEQLGQILPALKTLYVSGYTNDTVLRHGVNDGQVPFLNKPFTGSGFLRKVREALDTGN